MSFGQILTAEQWALLAEAEKLLYDGWSSHPYTDVTPREEGQIARTLWDHAEVNVEAQEFPGDDLDVEREIARRVAYSLCTLAFGLGYLNGELRARVSYADSTEDAKATVEMRAQFARDLADPGARA